VNRHSSRGWGEEKAGRKRIEYPLGHFTLSQLLLNPAAVRPFKPKPVHRRVRGRPVGNLQA